MNTKGSIVAITLLLVVLIVGGVARYFTKGSATSTPAAVINVLGTMPVPTTESVPETSSTNTVSSNSREENTAITPPYTPTQAVTNGGDSLVQVTSAGTLAQRYNLMTTTNVDYSYAISFPRQWTSSGASMLVTVTNGHSSVEVASQAVTPGMTAEAFGAQSGAVNGFVTTAVNGYRALETVSGNQTTYYIVNGAVGYKIMVNDFGDTDTLHTILLTFTVTKQR